MRRLAPIALLLVCATVPATAYAVAAMRPDPRVAVIHVQLRVNEPCCARIVVNARLATATPLPATVRLPLPDGATIGWSGEIVGMGESSEYVTRTPSVVDGSGGKAMELVLRHSREAQYEADYTAPVAEGGTVRSTLRWVQSAPADSLVFAVLAGPNVQDVVVDPAPSGAPQFGDAGERLYVLAPLALEPGAPFELTAAFAAPATGATTPAPVGGSPVATTILVVAVLGLAAAILGIAVVLTRQRHDALDSEPDGRPRSAGDRASGHSGEGGADSEDPFGIDLD